MSQIKPERVGLISKLLKNLIKEVADALSRGKKGKKFGNFSFLLIIRRGFFFEYLSDCTGIFFISSLIGYAVNIHCIMKTYKTKYMAGS